MIEEVGQKEIFKKGYTTGFPITDAVVSRTQDGKIFADLDERSNFFILHKASFGFVAPDLAHVTDFVDLFVENPTIPTYFHLYDPPAHLTNDLRNRSDRFNLKDRKRLRLIRRDRPTQSTGVLALLPQTITTDNVNKLETLELGIGRKFWRSEKDFLTNGFGVCLFDTENNPLAACYSACVAGGLAEIDIQTSVKHRGKGFGRIVTDAFVNVCLDRGLVASWDCFEENSASLRTALTAGFSVVRSYQFISIFNKSRQHE